MAAKTAQGAESLLNSSMKKLSAFLNNWRPSTRYSYALLLTFCLLPVWFVRAAEARKDWSLSEIEAKWKSSPLEEVIAIAEGGEVTAQHYLGYFYTEGKGGTVDYPEGRKWYLKAAELKFPNSINNLGVIYLYGRGVAKDLNEAKKYFQLAAEQGDAVSQENLARLLLYSGSNPSPEEIAEAMMWLKKASDSGSGSAQVLYGYLLMYPVAGGKRDSEQAIKILESAAAKGHLDAYRQLGNIYLDPKFPQKNEQTAIKHFQTGADLGGASCQSALGWAYFNGVGGQQSQELAIEWLMKAAQQQYAYAYHNLGRVYSGEGLAKPSKNFRPDYEKACEWLKKAAAAGNGDSAHLYGKIICLGLIPWKSKTDSLPILEPAAKAGHYLARSLYNEIQVEQLANTKDEFKVLESLALTQNLEAMNQLARYYRTGYGVKTDPVRTFRYEMALRLMGNSSAESIFNQINNINGSYRAGSDGKSSRIVSEREKRFKPIYQALMQALARNDTAYYQIQAKRYLDGGEMPKNICEAAIWFQLAADAGDASAKEQVALLDAQMDESQRATTLEWVGWLKLYQKLLR